MTLTTHAIVGAGIASLVIYNPALGICAAFASHFVIEAIPHWSYEIKSASVQPHGGITHINFSDKNFVRDFCIIGTDGILGIILSLFLFSTPNTFWIIFAATCAAMLPDVLLFAYSRFKHEPLISLQKFHEWVHSKYQGQIQHMPIFGIISQILLIVIFVIVVKFVL